MPKDKRLAKPCGPNDNRLKGHRCGQCRQSHVKCDGKTPCSRCVLRKLDCGTVAPATEVAFLCWEPGNVQAKPSSVSDASLLYIEAFFSFIGQSPSPLTNAFLSAKIGHMIEEVELIRSAVVAIGVIYSRQTTYRDITSNTQQPSIKTLSSQELRSRFQARTQESDAFQLNSTFVLALLSSILDLMEDSTGLRWYSSLHQISERIVQPRGPAGFCGQFERSLLTFYKMSEALSALSRDEDTFLAGAEWHGDILNFSPDANSRINSEDQEWAVFDYLTGIVAIIARINARSTSWLKSGNGSTAPPEIGVGPVSHLFTINVREHKQKAQEGFQIVSEASEAFKALTQLQPRIQKFRHADFLMAYYHCGLISISRLFVDQAWMPYEPPIMSEMFIKQGAVAALECIEKVVQAVQLEAVFLLPLLLVVSLEMREQGLRARIATVFNIVQERGFAVASTYVSDISLLWEVFKVRGESLQEASQLHSSR